MNQPITQTYNLGPRYFRVAGAIFCRDSAGRFSQNLYQAHQREIQQPTESRSSRVLPCATETASLA